MLDQARNVPAPTLDGGVYRLELYPGGQHIRPYSPYICRALAARAPNDAKRNTQNLSLYALSVWFVRVYPELRAKDHGVVAKGLCDSRFDGQRHRSMPKMRELDDYDVEVDGGKDADQPFELIRGGVIDSREDSDECMLTDDVAEKRCMWKAVKRPHSTAMPVRT